MTRTPSSHDLLDPSFVLKLDEIMARPPDWSDPFGAVEPGATAYEMETVAGGTVSFRIEPDLPLMAKSNYWILHSSEQLTVGLSENGPGMYPPHRHPDTVQWTFVYTGSVYLVQPDGWLLHGPGDVSLLARNVHHTVMVPPGAETIVSLQIIIPGNNFNTLPLTEGREYEKMTRQMRDIAAGRQRQST